MKHFKAKWHLALADLVSWSYLGYLVMGQEYMWAGIWSASILILMAVRMKRHKLLVVRI